MIKIQKVEILNYRSCLNTTIDVQEELTTLIGINGVGKTNILNSLQLLKKTNQNRFFQQSEIQESLKHSNLKLYFKIETLEYILTADIFFDTVQNNLDEIYTTDIQYKHINDEKWINIEIDLFAYIEQMKYRNKKTSNEGIEKNQYLSSNEGKMAVKIVRFLAGISYYSATQFSDATKCPIAINLDESKRFNDSRNKEVHGKFLLDLYQSYKNENIAFKRFISTVNRSGIGLVDEIIFFEHLMSENSSEAILVNQIGKNNNIIIPSIKIDGIVLAPNQLSEGTFKTLALIFYILNDKNELLLIEEPEVCVHHGLLNSVIELIKIQSKEKQIIISTHSDFVLDKLSPSNIILVKKDRENGTVAKPLSKLMSKNDYLALKEYLDSTGNLGEYWKSTGFEDE